MKKVLSILMVLGVMSVFLAGCGSKDDASATPDASKTATAGDAKTGDAKTPDAK